jgi:membrane fusion protein (multidrug efflux system)
VLSGLKSGDTVLTSGVMMLRNGIPVKVNLIKPAENSKLK